MILNKKKFLFKTITILILITAPALMADTLGINVGYWPGELDPELEERFFLDDLVGQSRVDLPWDNKMTHTIYPLGLTYTKKMDSGDIILNANYMLYRPEYSFTGIDNNSVSTVNLVNYNINDTEIEAGYKFRLADNKFSITPKVGFRKHNKSFTYNELTLGNTITKTIDSYFEAQTSGLYLGVDLQYFLNDQFSLIFNYVGASAVWQGEAAFEKVVAGANITTGQPAFAYENATSGYELSIQRWAIGVEYKMSDEWKFQAGLRQETLTQSYPEYINLAFGSAGLNFNNNEILTDYVIYGQKIDQTKGLFFVSATYSLNL